ncbi:similar to Saccharomyces cerevisiae YGR081C SLX9 Protein required for pre-rRNA processing [Maudiozyma barnettii]|uniref:Ribosome biogenesis protein SLX9 n=1 Tax=Maudiozyma barnettii TaxID=61262 RepID=A0A8H2ZH92_9SACH|nr:Slx9p [Kazachstania barnettii]CAB4251904.1 similar to Saccharomyces cerevisiae YGR081C SLX9 Protein required for pre-rRNA processing [Kazachstania barnettii]CAD1778229.1 similar to Saccharomyces cerevisiae YGR081C SLX9 Protein required for pre-rRNA processing [Kazachstania barnettii]
MAAKKRNTLRNKAATRLGNTSKVDEVKTVTEFTEDPKAYLHQFKETKKEKLNNKQNDFLSKIKNNSGSLNAEFDGISKSSVRRRKRKIRDNLKPRLDDLLTSLQKEDDLGEFTRENVDMNVTTDNINIDQNPFSPSVVNPPARIQVTKIVKRVEPGSIKKRKNEPNIRNKKGAKLLASKERKRFNEVITNQVFKQNSFSALRDIIKMQKE